MKRLFLLFMLLGVGSVLMGQKVTRQQSFNLGYNVNSIGYPSKIVPAAKGGFAYIEYWTRGGGRKFPNFYLQHYNAGFEEEWFRPVTRQNDPEILVTDIFKMPRAIAVVGMQYAASQKDDVTKMQLYSLEGREKGGLKTISIRDKKAKFKKGFEDQFAQSPDSSKLLLLSHNPSASAKSRRSFVSVWDDAGMMTWSKELMLPYVPEKYKIKQVAADNRGNAYFLLVYEELTNSEKDTLHLPILLRWDYRAKKMAEYLLDFPAASVPECAIQINEKGDLAFMGILSDGSEKGFMNGAMRFDNALKWNKIVYKLFNIERELKLSQEYLMDIPESWVKKYGQKGANFSKSLILERSGKLYWVLEEFYTTTHNGQPQFRYYDIATVAMDMKSGAIEWANNFEKKQRDYNSGRLLSFVPGITGGSLRFVYLNERGAQGKIVCTNVDQQSGEATTVPLARNEKADFLFFPNRSSMVSKNKMILMGVGNPVANDYKLIEITF